jgi:ArsR family transcriptional regulator, nickel/cobalt-responsive transcriptional repressor
MSHDPEGAPTRIDRRLAEELAVLMQALSAPSRLLILGELREHPRPVGELAAAIGMEPSAVSQQLRVLRHLGFVVGTRTGRQVVYALHDPHVATLLDEAAAHVAHRLLALPDPVGSALAEQPA